MKLKEYLKKIQEAVKENPSILEMEVIYSADDEGNAYQKVHNEPTPCQIEDINEYFLEMVGFEDDEEIATEDCNAICIN